ncbi:MAG: RNA polymerase sigma factor [Candidatus Krumholzibacteriota bacterium]|nr:RNA polymerase sigma factor [Candidatus Krumholzibacteriota bacterium]
MPSDGAEPDKALLLRARDGDREAFSRLARRYAGEATRIALGYLGSEEDARDMVQEAFLRALRHMDHFDAERPFFPWFYRILRNLCFNFMAKRGRHGECPLVCERDGGVDPPGRGADPFRALVASERASLVWEALQTLSPEHREIIVLRHFRDLSYTEIAEALDIPRGTVMSRLFYARSALRRAIDARLGDESGTLAADAEVS